MVLAFAVERSIPARWRGGTTCLPLWRTPARGAVVLAYAVERGYLRGCAVVRLFALVVAPARRAVMHLDSVPLLYLR